MNWKRLLVILLTVTLLMGQVAFADKFLEYETVELIDGMNNIGTSYTTAGMTLAGMDVITDVPSILYNVKGNTRTLVPISFVAKSMGAKVSWDQDTKTATFSTGKNVIKLQADNPKADIDGILFDLPNGVPPKLMGYKGNFRLLVPIKFVAEQFNLEVGWDGDTRMVVLNYPRQSMSDIRYDETKMNPEIRIKTTGEVRTTSYFLSGSQVGGKDKIVIDLENTEFSIPDYKLESGKENIVLLYGDVKKISTYAYENKSRVEIDLDRRRGYDTFYDADKGELVIRFINSVQDIRTEQIYAAEAVIINTGEEPAYNVQRLQDMVIVDVMNSLMKVNEGQYGTTDINEGGVKSISYSQFEPSAEYDPSDIISRVVVKLEDDTSIDDVFIEHVDNEIIVYVSGDPLNGFDYAKNSLDTASLKMGLQTAGTYRSTYDESAGYYWVYLQKSTTDLSKLDVQIDDSIIDRIVIDDSSDQDEYIVKIDLADGTKVLNPEGTKQETSMVAVAFANEALKNSIYRNTLVVIDAGHGGWDPGAVGSFTQEKVLALEASKRLKKELEGQGFKTYMIRDTDVRVQLQQRSKIANELNADLFISVHFNAAESTKARGIETLYAPEPTGQKKKLAYAMQDALIDKMGSVNRGVVERPNLHVTRATNMPSVIVELGFVTNAEEEKRISTPEFMVDAGKAMLNGILNFLKK